MSASDIFERAAAYIQAHGDAFDRARLAFLQGESAPLTPEQRARFFTGQRADGGWAPFWAADYSSLDATCYQIAQADGLGLTARTSAEIRRALDFLRARQLPDGSWQEDAAFAAQAPSWARPGDLAARLYLTANCGWSLADETHIGLYPTEDEAASRAGDYLAAHIAADGSFPSFLHTHWLADGLSASLGRSDLAYRTRAYLTERIDASVPASSLAWLLVTLGWLGLPLEHPLGQKATALLIASQRADGSWQSEDDPARDAATTVEALRGLLRWRAI